MAGQRYAYVFAAGLLIGGFTSGGASAQDTASVEVKGVRDAGKWFRVESQHFVVHSDSSNAEVVELLNGLERLDYLLRLYAKPFLVGPASAPKLHVYFHNRTGWLTELGGQPAEAIGLYNSCVSGVQAFAFNVEPLTTLKDEQLTKERLNESLSYIFEAYARHFLYRHTDIRAPASFIDGFAQYFSSVRFSDKQLAVGRVPGGIGQYLHMLDEGNAFQLTFEDVLDNKPARVPDDPAALLEFQARSWTLMHFMMASDEQRGKLEPFLNAVNGGASPAAAFAQAYGLSGDALRLAMWRYRLGGVKVVRVDVPELPQARMEFTQLNQASAEFVLADAALKACPGRPKGEALLRTVRAAAGKVPSNDFAQLTLSRAQIDWGDPAEALGWLERVIGRDPAVGRDPKHTEALYLHGLANLKLAERTPAQRQTRLAAARRSLAQALSLQPGSPQASFALYRAELGDDEPAKAGIARAILAWRNAHEVNTYARSAALAYAWMGDAAGSFRAFNVLARNGRDPEAAAWAKAWLTKLEGGVARAELLAAMRREVDTQAPFKEWTVAHTDLMRAVARQAGLKKAQTYLNDLSTANPASPDAGLGNTPGAGAR